VALISVITFFVTKEILDISVVTSSRGMGFSSNDTEQFLTVIAAVIVYAFAYALTALLLQRKLFAKRPPKIAGLLAVSLAAAWAVLPSIVFFFLNQLSWNSLESLQLGNAFNIFSQRYDQNRLYHLYFAGGWLALMVVLNANWFWQQVKYFRPANPAEIPPPLP
jgi:hypothetical protein